MPSAAVHVTVVLSMVTWHKTEYWTAPLPYDARTLAFSAAQTPNCDTGPRFVPVNTKVVEPFVLNVAGNAAWATIGAM